MSAIFTFRYSYIHTCLSGMNHICHTQTLSYSPSTPSLSSSEYETIFNAGITRCTQFACYLWKDVVLFERTAASILFLDPDFEIYAFFCSSVQTPMLPHASNFISPHCTVVGPRLADTSYRDDPTPSRGSQLPRAAALITSSLGFVHDLRAGMLEPDNVRGIPLDMDQYTRLFGTARIPTQVRVTL